MCVGVLRVQNNASSTFPASFSSVQDFQRLFVLLFRVLGLLDFDREFTEFVLSLTVSSYF